MAETFINKNMDLKIHGTRFINKTSLLSRMNF